MCPRLVDPFHTSARYSLSLEFEWQQDSASLQDSSQYSRRSQQCCRLDGHHSSSYFRVLPSLCQSFRDSTKGTNYNWYNRHFHVSVFSIPLQGPGAYASFHILSILLCGQPRQQSPQFRKFSIFSFFFFFLVDYYKVSSSVRDQLIRLYLKIPEEFSRTDSGLNIYHLFV